MGSREAVAQRLRDAGCVFATEEADLLLREGYAADELERRVVQRESGVPLQHVLGWTEFCGIRVCVDPGVFIPRPRSAALVEAALVATADGSTVVDVCCGSGALGLVIARRRAGVVLVASDIDPAATACARENLAAVGGTVVQGDLFAALPSRLRGGIDTLIVNAPYVPTTRLEFLHVDARGHEPSRALDGGPDGLTVHRRVAADAAAWLAPDGCLVTEVAEDQASELLRVMGAAGLAAEASSVDGLAIVVARRAY